MNVFTMANTRNDPYGQSLIRRVEYGEGGEEAFKERCRNPYPILRERFARFRELREETRELIQLRDSDGLNELVKKFITVDIDFPFADLNEDEDENEDENDVKKKWFQNGVMALTRTILTNAHPSNPEYVDMVMDCMDVLLSSDPRVHNPHRHTFIEVGDPAERKAIFLVYEALNMSCRSVETVFGFLGIPMSLDFLNVCRMIVNVISS